eukprot:scaffold179049_cov31-Tisochrysis_lutea.AAC.4
MSTQLAAFFFADDEQRLASDLGKPQNEFFHLVVSAIQAASDKSIDVRRRELQDSNYSALHVATHPNRLLCAFDVNLDIELSTQMRPRLHTLSPPR